MADAAESKSRATVVDAPEDSTVVEMVEREVSRAWTTGTAVGVGQAEPVISPKVTVKTAIKRLVTDAQDTLKQMDSDGDGELLVSLVLAARWCYMLHAGSCTRHASFALSVVWACRGNPVCAAPPPRPRRLR